MSNAILRRVSLVAILSLGAALAGASTTRKIAVVGQLDSSTQVSGSCSALSGWYGMEVGGSGKYLNGAIFLDGNCNLSGSHITGGTSSLFRTTTVTGTYGLNSDGTYNLNLIFPDEPNPETYIVGVSQSGNKARGVESDNSYEATIDLQSQLTTLTNGYGTASLSGPYAVACSGLGAVHMNYVTFDGQGNLTGVDSFSNGNAGTNPYTGTYSVNSDGTFSGSLAGGYSGFTFNGVLENGISQIEYNYASSGSGGVLSCVGRQSQSGAASLAGYYGFVVGAPTPGPIAADYFSGALYFDGAGNLSGTVNGDINTDPTATTQFGRSAVSGSYVVNNDSVNGGNTITITMTFSQADPPVTKTFIVAVGESGNEALGIQSDGVAITTIDLQSQLQPQVQPLVAYSNASLNGIYSASCGGSEIDLNYTFFDGNGNIPGTSVDAYYDGGYGYSLYQGSYSVNPDGTFTATFLYSYDLFTLTGVIDNGNAEIEFAYDQALGVGGRVSCIGESSYGQPVTTSQVAVATPTLSPAPGVFGTAQTVTLSDTTPGASIYYTNNGMAPTIYSTPYTAPIQTTGTTTIQAIAAASGYNNSGIGAGTYFVNPGVAATPAFSPAGGTYNATQTVVLSDTTPGAIIYYTTDGTTPTTGSNVYSAPLTVSATTTVQAIAVATGFVNSPVASAVYTIVLPPAPAPVFNPAPGTYNPPLSVTLSDTNSGAAIYYTTNGSIPTTGSSLYTGAISLSANATIQAIAVASGYTNSAVASAAYTINLPTAAAPTFSPVAGTYTSAQSVALSDATSGAVIYYTTNGSTPTTTSTVYSTPIPVSSTTTIQAIAVASGYNNSAVASGTFTINLPAAASPTFSPVPGTYTSAQSVALSDATSGAVIYYTTNGSTPTTASTVYTTPIPVSTTTTIQAIAVATGYNNSAVAGGTFTINLPSAAAPAFSPAGGTFTSVQSVTLSDTTPGAVIHYTTNGATPNATSAVYSSPILVSATTTIQAIATATGYNNSAVATSTYTITGASSGTFTLVQHVHNVACATGTTCALTLNQSIAAGDMLVFESSMYPASIITGTNNGGTFSPCLSCSGFDPTYSLEQTSGGWILTAAAQSSPITVNFSAAASGEIEMWEYSTGGGTPAFDGANQVETQNNASPVATAFTPSGTNDISVQACRASLTCNSVSAPFVADNTGNYRAWAALNTPTSWTGPTWTLAGSATSQLTQMEFGFGVTRCANSAFVDFGGPSGSTVTMAQLLSGTHGWQGGFWTIHGNGADLTFQTAASQTLQNPTGRLCDGQNYTDASTTGLQYSTADQGTYLQMNGTDGVLAASSVSVGTWYYSNLPPTTTGQTHDLAIFGTSAQDYVLLQELTNGTSRIAQLGCGSGGSTSNVTLARSTWYWIDIQYNKSGNHTMKVYNNANPPVQVGSTMTCASKGTASPGYITIGNVNSGATVPSGYLFYYDGLLVSLDGTDPLLPGSALPATTATPTFNPTPGSYTSSVSVSLSDSTSAAAIYYTTDGSTPTPSSAPYSSPIQITATTTIKAIAVAPGFASSAVASGTYTVSLPTAAAPTFSPVPGTYTSAQTVALSDATSNAVIYYTTDGSVPTISSAPYTSPITVGATTSIQAIAVATGYNNSAVASGTYTINLPTAATPAFSPAPGTYTSVQSVTLSDATAGAVIYYTTNGSTPTTASAVYTSAIPVNATTTIQAIAVAPGYNNSAVASGVYTINLTAAAPILSPVPGTYTSVQSVTLSDATSGAVIHYTLDGTVPTITSPTYTSAIAVNATTTIQAIAVATGYSNSAVAGGLYTINLPNAAAPTFNPAPGTYTSIQSVTLADATPGAVIHYTTNGTVPSATSTTYSSPLSVSATTTIQAIAVAAGYNNSSAAGGTYTINLPPAAAPVLNPAPGNYTSTQTVVLSDTTSGAVIYYTIDGTTPTTSSAVYSAPLTVSATTTVQAIAVATGYTSSAVAGGAYTFSLPAASAPVFNPTPGTFTSVQSVTLSDATSGAAIHYTTNGSIPTASSPVYSSPIAVNATTTIQAIATASGYNNSPVAGGTYTINLPTAATPTFSPASGTYTSVQSVTLSDTTSGATIYYTTNGSTPTTASTVYTSAIPVNTTTTIQAIAVAAGYNNSAVASGVYTINLTTATPAFSPAPGTYTSVQSVTLSDTTSGATIYYTTNGSTPTTASSVYSSPIPVNTTTTIQAIAVATGYTNSAVAGGTYTLNLPVTAAPTFSPAPGTYTTVQSVTLSDATVGATIYYTTNGSTPTAASTVYSSPIPVNTTTTIQAIAVATGYNNSAVTSGVYTINLTTATPAFSPAPGTYTSVQSVTLSDVTSGATIYYTTNGAVPNTSSAIYSSPIPVNATTTIQALAVAAGYTNSAIASGSYTINLPAAAAPVFSPAPGSYTSVQSVTLSDATSGAVIHYTLDGTTPTASSPTYTSALAVNATTTIQAIAVATGYSNSPVAGGTYTINLTAASPIFSPAPGTYTSVQSVTLSDATSGAVIHYTLDGTTPTASSPAYTAALAVNATTTIQAIAVATGYSNSAVAGGTYTINLPTAATPTFSPAPGTYTSTQSVTLSDATPGAVIHYTTNGTAPSAGSATYSAAIPVTATTTIQAIAIATGYNNSAVASGVFTINSPLVNISGLYNVDAIATSGTAPKSGGFDNDSYAYNSAVLGTTLTYQGLTFTLGPANAADAISSVTVPLPAGQYTQLFLLGAAANGAQASQSIVVTYTDASTTTFTQSFSDWGSAQNYSGETAISQSATRINPSGSTQTFAVNVYGYTFPLNSAKTLASVKLPSNRDVVILGVGLGTSSLTAVTPTFSPAAGTYTSTQSVTLSDTTPGAVIHYTTNGTTPTASSTTYSAAIPVTATTTIQAIAVATGYNNSAVASATYTINLTAATPTFSPAAGTYTSTQSVTLSDTTPGAVIHYTTNGTTPTASSATYSAAIPVTATTTIQAIAIASGYANSAVASATYTINLTAATPTFSPAAGTYNATQSVTLADTTPGAVIHYTTNGTTPTASSATYTAAIPVTATTTVQAIAIAAGYTNSAVASATYTINLTAATPTFSLAAGIYTSTQSVTLADTTPGAVIHYTTNGTTPTASSTTYSGAISVTATTTIEAIAIATGYTNSAVASATYTIQPSTVVSLTSYYNVDGIATSGTAPKSGGLDGSSYAYNSSLIGTSLTFKGLTFPLGPANAADAVDNQTVPVAAGAYTKLYLVGVGVNGAQANQSIVVTYTDGTTSTFTQSFSDWTIPKGNTNETTVIQTANRITPTGGTQSGTIDVYGYSFSLTAGKTPKSVKLPASRNVVVLGIGWGVN